MCVLITLCIIRLQNQWISQLRVWLNTPASRCATTQMILFLYQSTPVENFIFVHPNDNRKIQPFSTHIILVTGWRVFMWIIRLQLYISALLALCEGNPSVTVGFPHKFQWRGALVFSLICAWTNSSANNQDAGDFRRHRAHYDVTLMICRCWCHSKASSSVRLHSRPMAISHAWSLCWLLSSLLAGHGK